MSTGTDATVAPLADGGAMTTPSPSTATAGHATDRIAATAVVVTKAVAGGFALGSLLATSYGATAVLGSLSTESTPTRRVDPFDGFGYLVGGPVLAVAVPLLTFCVVVLLCRRPTQVHGWAVAAGGVALGTVVVLRQVALGTFLDVPFALVGLRPSLAWAPGLLVVAGGLGLALAGARRTRSLSNLGDTPLDSGA